VRWFVHHVVARLDDMLAAHYEAAIGGSVDATYAVLAVMRHRAQLLNWIGTNREPASARLTIEGGGEGRKLDISFVLPSGKQMNLDSPDARPYSPSYSVSGASRVSPPPRTIDAVVNTPNSGVPIIPNGRKPTDWMS
jgi:hypothetical protein